MRMRNLLLGMSIVLATLCTFFLLKISFAISSLSKTHHELEEKLLYLNKTVDTVQLKLFPFQKTASALSVISQHVEPNPKILDIETQKDEKVDLKPNVNSDLENKPTPVAKAAINNTTKTTHYATVNFIDTMTSDVVKDYIIEPGKNITELKLFLIIMRKDGMYSFVGQPRLVFKIIETRGSGKSKTLANLSFYSKEKSISSDGTKISIVFTQSANDDHESDFNPMATYSRSISVDINRAYSFSVANKVSGVLKWQEQSSQFKPIDIQLPIGFMTKNLSVDDF